MRQSAQIATPQSAHVATARLLQGVPTSLSLAPCLAGGSAAIMLKDPSDNDARTKVRQLLDQMLGDPDAGIARVLEPSEFKAAGGFPDAALLWA
jgi:hypothetical protein